MRRPRVLTCLLATTAWLAGAPPASAAEAPPTRVVVQLKWRHQFQFAGYYAAVRKGLYARAGLDVVLLEGHPGRSSLAQVKSGAADFGVGDSDILLARMRGEPVVACAAVFQHSPHIIMTRRDAGLPDPQSLAGKRVMLTGDHGDAQLRAMFLREGVGMEHVNVVPHSWRLEDLVEGRVDALSAYVTVEPGVLARAGVEPAVIWPRDFGIDFYGDALFTTDAFVAAHPELVERFVRASMQGWDYALDHAEEMVGVILALDGVAARGVTRERLLEEARIMRELIMPDVVEIGHQNPGRWQAMANVFVETGLFSGTYSLDGFIYDPDRPPDPRWRRVLLWASAASGASVLLALVWVGQLRRQVRHRTAALESENAERRRTEEALRASEQRFRLIVDRMPVMIAAFDRRGRVAFWNAHCERVTGFTADEILGERALAARLLPTPALLEPAATSWDRLDADFDGLQVEIRARDGEPRTILVSQITERLKVPGWASWLIGLDLTDLRRANAERDELERQLQQAQKLESLGILAGGIAHDFNNLLSGILGHADLALCDLDPADRTHEHLVAVVNSARRAAELTRELLAYSGRGQFVVDAIDLSTLAHDMVALLSLSVGGRCRLELDTGADLPAVEGDATQLRQVLMNLVLNAAESIEGDDGVVTVSTGCETVDAATRAGLVVDDAVPDGRYVALTVRDNGCGMSEEVRARIFDPFFTTKFMGRGLGLASVMGIVRGHGGAVRLTSAPGQGTTFTMLLPVSTRAVAPAPVVALPGGLPLSGGAVLVVDDEESVRGMAVRMLARMGLSAYEAADGAEALRVFGERRAEILGVLLDMTMPGMSGEETFVALRRLDPGLHVLMTSGFSADDVVGRESLRGVAGFIQKPYRYEELEVALRAALATPAA